MTFSIIWTIVWSFIKDKLLYIIIALLVLSLFFNYRLLNIGNTIEEKELIERYETVKDSLFNIVENNNKILKEINELIEDNDQRIYSINKKLNNINSYKLYNIDLVNNLLDSIKKIKYNDSKIIRTKEDLDTFFIQYFNK